MSPRKVLGMWAAAGAVLLMAGCNHGMEDQPKLNAFVESDFFADGRSVRPSVPGTVAQGHADLDDLFYRGKSGGKDAEMFPYPVTPAMLHRGRERYDIYCSVCHGRTGTGDGMIVRRGFPKPPSFHGERLRRAPAGHFFDVISNGYGLMFSYGDRVDEADRWAIVAYIRALQLSQDARVADLPPEERTKLGREP